MDIIKLITKFFKSNGSDLINKSIGLFDKVINQLTKGIELVESEVIGIDNEINEIEAKKLELKNTLEKATKVLVNVKKLIQ